MIPFDEKVVLITEALGERDIPHAIGGAIALGYYAVPRATVDIDVNVFVAPSSGPAVVDVLRSVGVEATEQAMRVIDRDGQGRLHWDSTPVDLFFATDSFHEHASRRTREVPYPPDRIVVLAPEDLMVCKVMFDRPKDRLDIDQMLLATAGELDLADVRHWIDQAIGSDDQRAVQLEAAIARVLGPRDP